MHKSSARAERTERGRDQRKVPAVSKRFPDGRLVELLYRAEEERTLFAVAEAGSVSETESVELSDGGFLVPYSPKNNLLTHRAILLPSEAAEYQSESLRARVRHFIHRYVDLPEDFEEIAAHYVLFSWRFDDFPDLPYLRVLGDYGSGKTRFLKVVGAIVYRPIFASGASTASPIFRILDSIGGTLVLDEADFRFSDEKAEIVKILNNGNSKGFPVLRTEATPHGELNPRAFSVYGPKLVATRKHFDDPALESRCITATLATGAVRPDIPHTLPPEFDREACSIRNQLLMYRLREAGKINELPSGILRSLEPRIAQVFSPLLSLIEESAIRARLLACALEASTKLVHLRSDSIEADVITAALAFQEGSRAIPVKSIARKLAARENGAPLSPRAVGAILRRLGLSPRKRQGNYVLPAEDAPRLALLAKRYSAGSKTVDVVDIGEKEENSGTGRDREGR